MPTPAEPPKPVICPECGTPDIEPSRATITRHRLVALVPRTTIALLLLAAIAWAWFSRVSFPFSSGGTSSDVDLARVAVTTWGTLRSAAGGHSDGFLTRAARCALVRDSWYEATAEPSLCVRVITPSGDVQENRIFGWPIRLILVNDVTGYDDFRAKRGPVPAHTLVPISPPWQSGNIEVYTGTLGAGPTHRRITWHLFGTAYLLLLALAAAWAGRRIFAPIVIRERSADRAAVLARRAGAIVATTFMAIAALRSGLEPISYRMDPLSPFVSSSQSIDLGITQEGLGSVIPGATSDATIAARALEKCSSSASDNALVVFTLAAPSMSPSGRAMFLGPMMRPWLSVETRSSRGRWPSSSIGWWGTYVRWNSAQGETIVSLQHISLAPYVLLLVFAFYGAQRTTRFLLTRSAVSRRSKGLCQRCAYPLPFPPAPAGS